MTSRHRIVTGNEHRHSLALAVALVAALVTAKAQADTIYWNGEGLPWSATTSVTSSASPFASPKPARRSVRAIVWAKPWSALDSVAVDEPLGPTLIGCDRSAIEPDWTPSCR